VGLPLRRASEAEPAPGPVPLRNLLGEDALESDGEVVSLNAAAIRCDVSLFEILVREGSRDSLSVAADLYRGRLIDDVTVGEEGWNEWLTGERDRLRELALGAMVGLGEQELVVGHAERALKAGQRAIGSKVGLCLSAFPG
jgi:DNA-binding SARP family transcriptional activator